MCIRDSVSDEQQQFLASLAALPRPPVVLSTFSNYNTTFVVTDTVVPLKLRTALTDLHREDNIALSASEFDRKKRCQ